MPNHSVLRTIYLDPAVDDALRDEAFTLGVPKNDLLCHYLAVGMALAARNAAVQTADGQLDAVLQTKPKARKRRKSAAAG